MRAYSGQTSEHSGFSRTTRSLAHINPISNHKSKHRSLFRYKNRRFTFYYLQLLSCSPEYCYAKLSLLYMLCFLH